MQNTSCSCGVHLSLSLEYIKKYATEEALKDQEEMSSSSESSISDFSEDEAQDMELWHENRQFLYFRMTNIHIIVGMIKSFGLSFGIF